MTIRDYDKLLEAKEAWWEQNDREKDARIDDSMRIATSLATSLGQKDVQIEKLHTKIRAMDKLTISLIIPLARKFPTWNIVIGRYPGSKIMHEATAVYISTHDLTHGILVWNAEGPNGYLATICGNAHDLVDWNCDAKAFGTFDDLCDALQNVYARLW